MKKPIFITSLAVSILLIACKKNAPAATTTSAIPVTIAAGVPNFSDPAVNDFIKTYSIYADEYTAALVAAKAGDTSKLQALGSRAQELATKQQKIGQKLKPAETQAFSDAVMKIAQRLQDAAK